MEELEKVSKLNKKVKLRPHQLDAVRAIRDADGRGLLAHGTGTGKTLSSIAAVEALRKDGKTKKTLVITPASLQSNFIEKGVLRFTNNTAGRVGEDVDYQVLSIEKFRKNPDKILEQAGADTIVVDEIHRAKDPNSKTHKALRVAAENSKNFIGLTGSFISNHPREVVPLLDIVSPGHRVGTQRAFSVKHTKSQKVSGGFLKGPKKRTTLVARKRLKKNIGPVLHYIGHSDMKKSGLPSMAIKDVHVSMTKQQKSHYDFALGGLSKQQRQKIRDGLPPSQSEAQFIFTRILKARQASNSIGVHKIMDSGLAAEKTPKLKRIMDDVEEHLKKTPDGQAIVYSNFVVGGIRELDEGLRARGHDPGVYVGARALEGVTKQTREQDADDFLKSKKRIMLLSPAGGEGVSLNNATFFAEADRHYNPERNWQAIARGRRLGGLAHRKPKDRVLQVRRYYSDPKQGFFGRMFNKEVGVDEWIQRVADEKDRLNEEMRSTVRKGK